MKKLSFILIALFIAGSAFAFVNPGKAVAPKAAKVSVKKKKAKKPVSLYWYIVNSNITSGTVTNADCTYLNFGPGPSQPGNCNGTAVYYCIIGLQGTQTNTSTHQISGSQLPTTVNSWRPN